MKVEIPEYTKSEFEDLLYPLFDVPQTKSIITVLKKELDYKEFHVKLDDYGFKGWQGRNQVLKYIACVYDQKSPFNKDFKDVNKRKYASALYVGFEPDEDGRFEIGIESMMICMIDPITEMIVRYVRNHHDHDWAYLKTIEDFYYNALKNAMKTDEVDFKELKSMKSEIYDTENIILARDRNRRLEDHLYDHMDHDRIELRPEDIALKLRNKKDEGIPAKPEAKVS